MSARMTNGLPDTSTKRKRVNRVPVFHACGLSRSKLDPGSLGKLDSSVLQLIVFNCALVKLTIAASLLLMAGCSKDGVPSKIVYGDVTCGGEPVALGRVRFVPIDETPGPASTGSVVDGEYRIESRGGVPLGKHRVEVFPRKKTGRKVMGAHSLEPAEVDEIVLLGPPEYEGPNSPLVREVTDDMDGRIDIEIPLNPDGPRPGN